MDGRGADFLISFRRRLVATVAAAGAIAGASCGGSRDEPARTSLDGAARSYVRLVLALGERDSDSLDNYHGPAASQSEVRAERPTLARIRSEAAALARALEAPSPPGRRVDDEQRRAFLVGQVNALVSRIDVLQGARPPFDQEVRLLFGIDARDDPTASGARAEDASRDQVVATHAELERILPGHGSLAARYAAFNRRFLVPADRLPAVLARAIDGCRAGTRAHLALP